jgi:cytochrome-b5 reductase
MDWIRKMNNTPNISGTNGKILHITEEELAKHNKKTDCWLAISGRIFLKKKNFHSIVKYYLGNVYNVTPYLDYHPGGIDEIMKGAGIDATTLFQEIHSWVSQTNENDLF